MKPGQMVLVIVGLAVLLGVFALAGVAGTNTFNQNVMALPPDPIEQALSLQQIADRGRKAEAGKTSNLDRIADFVDKDRMVEVVAVDGQMSITVQNDHGETWDDVCTLTMKDVQRVKPGERYELVAGADWVYVKLD